MVIECKLLIVDITISLVLSPGFNCIESFNLFDKYETFILEPTRLFVELDTVSESETKNKRNDCVLFLLFL